MNEEIEQAQKDLERDIQLAVAMNLVIAGYLNGGGEIEFIPSILREMAEGYEQEIKNERDE